MKTIYLIGSLRNPKVPVLGQYLRSAGWDVFDDWYAAGEKADDAWQAYEQDRGHDYAQALYGYAATHVFEFDYKHLNTADVGVLYLPAGRSGHLELGWLIGRGKPGYILMEEDGGRWDVMYRFANRVLFSREALLNELEVHK